MALELWDIDRFPLKTAASTPGQSAADKWLKENSDESFDEPVRAVTPADIQRLMQQPDDPRDRDFAVATGGGGHEQQTYTPYGQGYNTENRNYPGGRPEGGEPSEYHMPGITHSFDDDEDEEYEREPINYHVVTGPVGSTNPDQWTEHPYTMFESPHMDMDSDAAHDAFMEDHPQYNAERNINATHEVKHVHPEDHHDTWHNRLRSEDEAFRRIEPHGFRREAPDVPGHMSYRHDDPHGGRHRLWHNYSTFTNQGPSRTTHGPGWRTSYWNPDLHDSAQLPWNFHGDDSSGDSLGDALERVQRNQVHADVAHSGTGLRAIENLHGRHYVSQRPDGSTQQLLVNTRSRGEEPNWFLTHYNQNPASGLYSNTEHGTDLHGALAQARANLARG